MTRLFLDTEWADLEATQLVSLALVSEDGAQRFYAEVSPLPAAPTAFVREVVYPLLDRGSAALPPAAFAHALRTFLARLPSPLDIVFDYRVDSLMLGQALDGVEAPHPALRLLLVRSEPVIAAVETYFATHADARARRHRADVDAEALRWAVLQTMPRGAPAS